MKIITASLLFLFLSFQQSVCSKKVSLKTTPVNDISTVEVSEEKKDDEESTTLSEKIEDELTLHSNISSLKEELEACINDRHNMSQRIDVLTEIAVNDLMIKYFSSFR